MKEFQLFWQYVSAAWAAKFVDAWCKRAMRSRIEPVKKFARTVRSHRELLLNYFRAKKQFSSGVIEGLNHKAKVTLRKANGYRIFRIAELSLYRVLCKLPEPNSPTDSSDEAKILASSLMVIEHAERFGLSQLHQLRGRVGRGAVVSVCVLLYQAPLSPSGRDRLRAMAETHDGFEIARRDLQIRGPGEFIGARQSGDALLRFADLGDDAPLLQQARQLAPVLLAQHGAAARAHVQRWLDARADFLQA